MGEIGVLASWSGIAKKMYAWFSVFLIHECSGFAYFATLMVRFAAIPGM